MQYNTMGTIWLEGSRQSSCSFLQKAARQAAHSLLFVYACTVLLNARCSGHQSGLFCLQYAPPLYLMLQGQPAAAAAEGCWKQAAPAENPLSFGHHPSRLRGACWLKLVASGSIHTEQVYRSLHKPLRCFVWPGSQPGPDCLVTAHLLHSGALSRGQIHLAPSIAPIHGDDGCSCKVRRTGPIGAPNDDAVLRGAVLLYRRSVVMSAGWW